MHRLIKNLGVYLVLVVLAVSIVNMYLTPGVQGPEVVEIPYSQLKSDISDGHIRNFTIDDTKVTGHYNDGRTFSSNVVGIKDIADEAAAKGVEVKIAPPPETPWWLTLASSIFPTLLLIGVWIFFLHSMQGGGGKVMSFAKSKAKMFLDNRPKVTFADVAGCD